jgi:DMSO/TMAO reductase YedYZ molybdopterin-dependent catalytic subunit
LKKQPPDLEEIQIEPADLKKRSRRAILTAAFSGTIGLVLFKWVRNMDADRGIPWLLRRGLNAGDNLFKAGFRDANAPRKGPAANPIRENGAEGIMDDVDASTWRLSVVDPSLPQPLSVSLEDIKKLPATESAFEFKCIEGWSQNVECKGVRFSDFMTAYKVGFAQRPYKYASLTTIDGGYYVSMDMKSLLHPETLLCYEMSGQPLEDGHGFPLRLMTPVKYGVKNIKQIGEIAFTDQLPADFWAKQGYGDYLGL